MVWKHLSIIFSYSQSQRFYTAVIQIQIFPLYYCFQRYYSIISKIHIYQSWMSCQQCRHSLTKYKETLLFPFPAAQLLFYNCSLILMPYINKTVVLPTRQINRITRTRKQKHSGVYPHQKVKSKISASLIVIYSIQVRW